jgi:hypothetical protein
MRYGLKRVRPSILNKDRSNGRIDDEEFNFSMDVFAGKMTRQTLQNLSRDDLLVLLQWKDPSGCYTDTKCYIKDRPRKTLAEARKMALESFFGGQGRSKQSYASALKEAERKTIKPRGVGGKKRHGGEGGLSVGIDPMLLVTPFKAGDIVEYHGERHIVDGVGKYGGRPVVWLDDWKHGIAASPLEVHKVLTGGGKKRHGIGKLAADVGRMLK